MIFRGDIYMVNFGDSENNVQGGLRPAVIVQNDKGNLFSPITLVCPITSARKKYMPTHLRLSPNKENGMFKTSTILCEQIVPVGKEQLEKFVGKLDDDTMAELNMCLSISLGILQKRSV